MSPWSKPWQRLHWKLWREARAWLPLVFGLPPIAFTLGWFIHDYRTVLPHLLIKDAVMIGVGGVLLMIAVVRATHDWKPRDMQTNNLPVPPAALWVVSFLVPFALCLVVAGWTAAWSLLPQRLQMGVVPQWAPLYFWLVVASWGMAVGGCYLLTSLFSGWVGAKFGALVLFWVQAVTVSARMPFDPQPLNHIDADYVVFPALLAAGTIAGTALFHLPRQRQSLPRRRTVALSAALLPMVLAVAISMSHSTRTFTWPGGRHAIVSRDGALAVWQDTMLIGKDEEDSSCELVFSDRRKGFQRKQPFPLNSIPIGFRDSLPVVTTAQGSKVQVAVWDPYADPPQAQLAAVLTMPRPLIGLPRETHAGVISGSVSPDGHYALVLTVRRSEIPQYDLWLADLVSRHAKIVIPKVYLSGVKEAQWSETHAYVPSFGEYWAIRLQSAEAHQVPMKSLDEMSRSRPAVKSDGATLERKDPDA